MPISVACTSCDKKLQVKDELAGKKIKCPGCGTVLLVAAGAPAKTSPIKPAHAAPAKAPPAKAAGKPAAPPPSARDKVTAKPKKAPPPELDEDDDEDEDEEDMEQRPARASGKGARPAGRKGLWIAVAAIVLVVGAVAGYFAFFSSGPTKLPAPVTQKKPATVPTSEVAEQPIPIPAGGMQKGFTPVQQAAPAPVPTSTESVAKGSVALADVVPGDALVFVSVNAAVWNSPGLAMVRNMAGPAVEQEFQSKIGIPLADVDRLSVFTVAGFAETIQSQTPPVVVLLQTNKPMQTQTVSAAIMASAQAKGEATEVIFLSDQALLFGAPPTMAHYRAAKGKAKATGILERGLAQANTSKGVVAAVTVPPEAAAQAEVFLKEAPPFLAPFLKTKGVIAGLDLAERLQLNVALVAEDPAVAKEMKAGADALLALADQTLGEFAKNPQMGKLAMMGRQALKDLKLDLKDSEVTLAFQADVNMVVMGLLLPALEKVRGAAARTADLNNLKMISIAWLNHHDAKGSYPSQTVRKGLSWRVAILPFIEQGGLYQQFKLDEPWNSPHNLKLLPLMPKIYETAGGKAAPGRTHIQTFVGPGTINKVPTQGIKLKDITDGTANTLIFAEAATAVEWTKPDDIVVAPTGPIALGGSDPKFFVVAFADGRVERIPRMLDPQILRWLIDPADGNVIPDLQKK